MLTQILYVNYNRTLFHLIIDGHSMPRRNYQELSPYDFECLVRDLLAAEWNERLESFPPGPDSGIDVRLLKTKLGILKVIQCKHSPGGTLSTLRSKLTAEANKLQGRNLGEYWLATSANLSPAAKDEISKIFHMQALLPEHVFGYTDIDSLLDRHPDVERANYKLYITSSAVLELLLHNDLFVHAQDLLDGIEERRKYYVQGDSLAEAQQVLKKNHICIVSGPPGVGKTTLAEMLALNLIAEGYKPFWISEDVREADTLWKNGQKQLFLYDDFLGQNALAEKLGKNEDSRLLRLMHRAQKSPNHYLILTTREYILNAARQTYERLKDPSIEYSKVIVDLSSYSRFNRAHILYNHVYFSDLSKDARTALKQKRNYARIIEHENYNPRLIRLIVDTAVATGGDNAGSRFPHFAYESLSKPTSLWDHIFTHQLKEVERDVLLVLLTFTSHVSLEDFRAAVHEFRTKSRERSNLSDIQNAFSVLDGVFINFAQFGTTRVARFANPGIRDYVIEHLCRSPEIYSDLVSGVRWPEQIEPLWQFVKPPPEIINRKPTPTGNNAYLDVLKSRARAEAGLFREEIHTDFINNPNGLLSAAMRMIGAPSSQISIINMPDGSVTMYRENKNKVAEPLTLLALEISRKFYPNGISDLLKRMIEVLVPNWKSGRGNKDIALKIFVEYGEYTVRGQESTVLLQAARDWAADTLYDPDDFLVLRQLEELQADDGGLQSHEDLCDEYYHFAQAALDDLGYGDDQDSSQEELDSIQRVAEEFGLSSILETLFNRAQERISEMESQENEEDENPWRESGTGYAHEGGDVDTLFSTLE